MSNEVKKEFGDLVRNARKSKKMTQEDLADKSGLHSTYIGQIERGRRNPSLINIHKLMRALNTSISVIFPK